MGVRRVVRNVRSDQQTNTAAQDFEAELKKYNAVEQRIGDVPAVRNIGALSLETQPLKAALRAEAASWKAQFARNLHKQSAEDLRVRLDDTDYLMFRTEGVSAVSWLHSAAEPS